MGNATKKQANQREILGLLSISELPWDPPVHRSCNLTRDLGGRG